MTHDKDALIALRERVREAEGADREIDVAVLTAFGLYTLEKREPDRKEWLYPVGKEWGRINPFELRRATLNLSASIDAALALVERVLPGWRWLVEFDDHRGPPYGVIVKPHGDDWSLERRHLAKTAPLAILDALLTALIERETKT